MSINRTKLIALAVVTGLAPLVMAATPVFASTEQTSSMLPSTMQPGMSASTASAPISGWLEIAPHSSQWFKFKYSYDDSGKTHDSNSTPTDALVTLKMQDPNSVGFEVWTPGRLQNPQYAAKDTDHSDPMFEPVGVGTPMFMGTTHHHNANGVREVVDVTNPNVLTWSGGERASDTFYVVVQNKTDTPASYMLAVSGPTVSY
jgi:hypothetical protein